MSAAADSMAPWPPPRRRARFLSSTFERPCRVLMKSRLSFEHVRQIRSFGRIRRHDPTKISRAEPDADCQPENVDGLFRVGSNNVCAENSLAPVLD